MRWLCALVLFGCVASPQLAASHEVVPHLRFQDARAMSAFREGLIKSATLRKLVDQIEGSNMFVYVSLNPFMKSRLAGQTTWMGKSKEYRYLRVAINGDLMPDQIIATLGHELRHVTEVIGDESVVDEGSLVSLYRRIGKPASPDIPSGWETDAAMDTGFQVRRELRAAATVADSRISEQSKL